MKPSSLRAVKGGVAAAEGFTASGVSAGIKKVRKPDLALVVSESPGSIAGVFTNNRVVAAPVILDRLHLRHGVGQAMLINSGNANACTGKAGMAAAREMAQLTAKALGIDVQTVFVCSTGVIGQPLPIERIRAALPAAMARLRRTGGHAAAQAILTTDLRPKETARRSLLSGVPVTVGGMAKGSGMIHPDMATMLAFITTDAAIEQPTLQQALQQAVNHSFNCISVDGDTSTNDTVLCLANGKAGGPALRPGSVELATFQRMLDHVCQDLALSICRDGEGVTKVVKIAVTQAHNAADARRVARTVATSNLVKTALFGEDANWGRIMAAVGRADVAVDPNRIAIWFDRAQIVREGVGLGPAAEKAISRVIHRKEFTITIDLGQGTSDAHVWTTDLSYDYVRINASYRS
jgi:glutamate N-acetyltransferase/amino-acid N-acetyltransferase